MLRPAFRFLLLLVLLGAEDITHAGVAEFSDRGKADFDTVIQLLNPYGTWAKIDGRWAYTPLDRQAPYTHGRWIYTEYGWYWKGSVPYSWATEHYGFWKRGADHVWSWYPGPYWLPQIVELRGTTTHIGWRTAAVDDDGNFVEAPNDRYAKTDEWAFVTKAQFTGPITPDIIVKPDVASRLLDDSSECLHTYVTYRVIDRPGPHPADFTALAEDGGMFPPRAYVPVPSEPKPAPDAKTATNAPATNAVPAPKLLSGTDDADSAADTRQVPYWITMSLPTYWTQPPADVKPNEVYIYRPDFYQDQDGIERRIGLWIDPASRVRLKDVFGNATTARDQPAPAPAAPTHGPFRSPFDDSFHADPSKDTSPAPTGKSAPAGPHTPAPSGAVTNAAPAVPVP